MTITPTQRFTWQVAMRCLAAGAVAFAVPVLLAQPITDGLDLQTPAAHLRITAIRDDIIRVRMAHGKDLPEDTSWALLPGSRRASIRVADETNPETMSFRTGSLQVSVERSTLRVTVSDLAGRVIVADAPGWPAEFHGSEFRVSKTMPGEEHYFGLGDKAGTLDRRNEAFTLWNTDAYGFQESTDPLYKAIPFFLAVNQGRCYGLLLDNTWRTSFDFGKEARDRYSFGAEGGPLDYYVLYGPDARRVLEGYAFLTGTAPLPPLWSLGFQQSRYSYYPEARVREIADRMRKDKIPSDVLYLDIHYQNKNRPFTVDEQRFPHFREMIADLRREHFRLIAITDLHIAALPNADYQPYDTGMAGDHFVKKPGGGGPYVGIVWPGPSVFPDFTREATREWWGGLYKTFYSEGIAGFWNDMNEPAVFEVPSKTMPLDAVHRIDEPGHQTRTALHSEIHNIMGMQNSRATYDGLLKLDPNQRPFVLTRASYAGGQRYAATWTGDNSSTWNHLRLSTPMLLNLGLSGFALAGDDIGGFAGTPPPDLLTRWIELGAFNPIDRDHTEFGSADQEVWVHGPEQEAIRRRYIEERYRLLPYLYTVTEESLRAGLPIMRPLFLEFPKANADGRPLDLDAGGEFLFGPDLLIAPAPFGESPHEYSVVLPPGDWYDYWSGGQVASGGGVHNTTETPRLDRLPVFVREGSIVPRQPLVQSTDETPNGPLELRVYPGDSCRGSLYQDDGTTLAYRHGELLRMDFSCQASADGLTVKIGAHQGSYQAWWKQIEVVVYGSHARDQVSVVGGRPLESRFDSGQNALRILVSDDGRGSELRLTARH
jgi:alpha-glucosidase